MAEQSEAEALFDFETAAPGATADALGMDATRLGGGVALSMRHDPTQFWSKALGFGFQEPATADLVDEVCDFYRSRSTPVAVLQFAPSALPDGWADIHVRANIQPGSTWVKLARELNASADDAEVRLDPALRVAPVEPGQAASWAATMLRGFGMPEEHLSDMVASLVGRPSWHPYGVWHGDQIVAAATMRVRLGFTVQYERRNWVFRP
ncbi:hypothetical protein Raf01_52600 [Rugosimonospora africana]|uniref:GNAT family N-acetyltransferase n=1 Tax=Rugosimonospora africana TaxID=556532 RepID=A0A8J3QUK4_9ACTN|nr:hypothetical protein Raf01_52600 [Rugosimonospora africana]